MVFRMTFLLLYCLYLYSGPFFGNDFLLYSTALLGFLAFCGYFLLKTHRFLALIVIFIAIIDMTDLILYYFLNIDLPTWFDLTMLIVGFWLAICISLTPLKSAKYDPKKYYKVYRTTTGGLTQFLLCFIFVGKSSCFLVNKGRECRFVNDILVERKHEFIENPAYIYREMSGYHLQPLWNRAIKQKGCKWSIYRNCHTIFNMFN